MMVNQQFTGLLRTLTVPTKDRTQASQSQTGLMSFPRGNQQWTLLPLLLLTTEREREKLRWNVRIRSQPIKGFSRITVRLPRKVVRW